MGVLKPFFSEERVPRTRLAERAGSGSGRAGPGVLPCASTAGPALVRNILSPTESARIAVYDAVGSAPRVEEVAPVETGEYISLLATRTYEMARAMGGRVPFSVINEVAENYIHADFRSPVVTILDSGNTIRFSDQGPGIHDKIRAVEPGYTTASANMKRYIRGVGSGLPLVRECLSFTGGTVQIEDNLGSGAVVTVSAGSAADAAAPHASSLPAKGSGESTESRAASLPTQASSPPAPEQDTAFRLQPASYPGPDGASRLTNRQKRVLALVMEAGYAGPSLVARELAIGLSTAYRDLAHLETLGLISSDESGKRALTPEGSQFLESLLHPGR